MKKLLHIYANVYPPLGVDSAIKRKWQELSVVFDEYHVLVRSEDNSFYHDIDGKLHLHRVPRVGNQCRSIYLTAWIIFYLIPKYRISGLLVNSAILGGLYATWASKLFRIPMMVEIHGDEYFRYLDVVKWYYYPVKYLIRYVLNNAIKIRSLSPKMTEKLADHGYTDQVVIIPNRVDLTLFNTPKSDFSTDIKMKLVSVGHFVAPKNYSNLIRILAGLDLEFQLTLIGGGTLQKEYMDLIEKFSLQEKVILLGRLEQTELAKKLIEADIYIQYSQSEGMPRTILEAMSLRMPVITTRVGSIEGIIEHGQNGYFVELNNDKSLKEALIYVFNDRPLRERIANNAYFDVVRKYEWHASFNLYRNELNAIFT